MAEEMETFYKQIFLDERAGAFAEIEELLKSHHLIVFIKGSARDPKDKHSKKLL